MKYWATISDKDGKVYCYKRNGSGTTRISAEAFSKASGVGVCLTFPKNRRGKECVSKMKVEFYRKPEDGPREEISKSEFMREAGWCSTWSKWNAQAFGACMDDEMPNGWETCVDKNDFKVIEKDKKLFVETRFHEPRYKTLLDKGLAAIPDQILPVAPGDKKQKAYSAFANAKKINLDNEADRKLLKTLVEEAHQNGITFGNLKLENFIIQNGEARAICVPCFSFGQNEKRLEEEMAAFNKIMSKYEEL